jgi:hypothetical protein
MRQRTPRNIYQEIERHAIKTAALIVFLSWLAKEVWKRLGF